MGDPIVSILNKIGLRSKPVDESTILPTDISDLILWLDPSDLTTITESSGLVSQIDDKSELGNNFNQGSASAQPDINTEKINGLPVLNFLSDLMVSGSDTQMNNDFTIIYVAKSNRINDVDMILGRVTSNNKIGSLSNNFFLFSSSSYLSSLFIPTLYFLNFFEYKSF